jgi:hypothetical protein
LEWPSAQVRTFRSTTKVGENAVPWVESWADRVRALGLSAIALPLLEVARALGPVGSNALLAAQPLLAGLADDGPLVRLAVLLDDPSLIDQFEARLDRADG